MKATPINKSVEGSPIEWNVIKVNNTEIANIYKPPPSTFNISAMPKLNSPSITCGDFNSRHTDWGYPNSNPNGEALSSWADSTNLRLLYNAKDSPSFYSKRHKSWTNPDLTFISNNHHNGRFQRDVLDLFPRSGHCPIILQTNSSVSIHSNNRKRWNFRKADWNKFSSITDDLTHTLPDPSNHKSTAYEAFTSMLSSSAKQSIPRGRRNNYIPCWDSECDSALTDYSNATLDEKKDKSDSLIQLLDNKRKQRWDETVDSIDFTHSSRLAWKTFNKLTGRNSNPKPCPVKADAIASVLVKNGKWESSSSDKKRERVSINSNINNALNSIPPNSDMSSSITTNELMDAIFCLKNGKAPGLDQIHPEFLKNMGLRAFEWLRIFLSNCLENTVIPSIWKQAKVVAILKPKKEATDPTSYRPISLLCVIYKLMERIILSRINEIVELKLPSEQAGFRKGKSTTDQVVRLINSIEQAFQRKQKYGLVLIDLSAAYDTVWHRGLYLKLLKTIPDLKLVRFIMLLVQDRSFFLVTSDGQRSRKRKLRNGLPQGSVLAPILFNIYISDMPPTTATKYLYADDSALGYAHQLKEVVEKTLERDLATLYNFFNVWHLKVSIKKTVCSYFHLANRLANDTLRILHDGTPLRFDSEPVYLGLTLDRSLTFLPHLKKAAKKVSARVNLIKLLAGSYWGANFNTLLTSTLALVFSTAEYACPAWSHSAHTKLVDVVINEALRVISGAIKPTPLSMLPVLAGITPPNIRRDYLCLKLYQKSTDPSSLVPHASDNSAPQRLNRPSFISRVEKLQSDHPFSPNWQLEMWCRSWQEAQTSLHMFIALPSHKPTGHQLNRKQWVTLNRLRSGWAKTASFMYKIGLGDSYSCICGAEQDIQHIIYDCPSLRPPSGINGLIYLDYDTCKWLQEISVEL